MILDYFLLIGSKITNKQCRQWLDVEDRRLVRRLLKNMGLSLAGCGTGSGLYYERPSHEYFDKFYRDQS